jgi:CHASE2 domain-containing sensor protein
MPGKEVVVTMTTALFIKKMRGAFVPMRKAVMDALLLGTTILIILFATSVLFTYGWLIIPTYALVFLLALVIRLRMASRYTSGTPGQEESLKKANETLISEKTAWV